MSTTDPVTTKGDPSLADDQGASEAQAYNDAMRQQIEFNKRRAALNAEISTGRKRMKANGIVLGAMDATIRMMEWSPAEVREHFAVEQRYARYARLPIGTQIDLLADATDDEVAAEDWVARGYAAAITGKGVPGVVPKECPPEFANEWLQGWNDGQLTNAPKPMKEPMFDA